MAKERVYFEQGKQASFTIAGGCAVSVKPSGLSQALIDWDSVIDLAGGKNDPDHIDPATGESKGLLVGEFTDETVEVRQVYLERFTDNFYYYKE